MNEEGKEPKDTSEAVQVTDGKTIKLAQLEQQQPQTDISDIFGQSVSSARVCGQSSARSTENTSVYHTDVYSLFASSTPKLNQSLLFKTGKLSRYSRDYEYKGKDTGAFVLSPDIVLLKYLHRCSSKETDFCSFPTKAISTASYINMGFILISVLDECFHTSYKKSLENAPTHQNPVVNPHLASSHTHTYTHTSTHPQD